MSNSISLLDALKRSPIDKKIDHCWHVLAQRTWLTRHITQLITYFTANYCHTFRSYYLKIIAPYVLRGVMSPYSFVDFGAI